MGFQKPFFLKKEDTTGGVSCQSRALLSGIGKLASYSRPGMPGFWAVLWRARVQSKGAVSAP